jgi:hypothetical protein
MTECRFCMAISVDGEPTDVYQITGTGSPATRYLCDECKRQLESIGLTVEKV